MAGRNELLDSLSATDSTAPIALALNAPEPATGVDSPSALVMSWGRPSGRRWTRAGLRAAPVRQFTIGEGLQVMNSARAPTLARVSQWGRCGHSHVAALSFISRDSPRVGAAAPDRHNAAGLGRALEHSWAFRGQAALVEGLEGPT